MKSGVVSLVCLIISAIILSLIFWVRHGLMEFIEVNDYIVGLSLLTVLLLLPDMISERSSRRMWFTSAPFITVIILVFSGLIGNFFVHLIPEIMIMLLLPFFALLLMAYCSYNGCFSHFWSSISVPIALGLLFFLFVLLIYNDGMHSIVFYEQIVQGLAHRDTLFHSSLTGIISTFNVPSTGLHGTPFIEYHWGSHYLFAGWKDIIGVDAVGFYNIFYPIFAVSLLIKSVFYVFSGYGHTGIQTKTGWVVFWSGIAVTVAAGLNIFDFIYSESTWLATILILLWFAILLNETNSIKSGRNVSNQFLFASIAMVLMVTTAKISSGLLFLVALSWILWRVQSDFKSMLWIICAIIATYALSITLIFSFETVPEVSGNSGFRSHLYSSIESLHVFWSHSVGVLNHTIGVLIFTGYLLFILNVNSFRQAVESLRDKSLLHLEVLAVLNIFGALPFLFFTMKSVDVYYFMYLQAFLAILFLTGRFAIHNHEHSINFRMVRAWAMIVVILSCFSRADLKEIYYGDRGIKTVKETAMAMNPQHDLMFNLMHYIAELKETSKLKTTGIYIPLDQDWYYQSQAFRDVGSYFIIPALAGIPKVGGVHDRLYYSDLPGYSFYKYQRLPGLPVTEDSTAIELGRALGFKKLIRITGDKGILDTEYIVLD